MQIRRKVTRIKRKPENKDIRINPDINKTYRSKNKIDNRSYKYQMTKYKEKGDFKCIRT